MFCLFTEQLLWTTFIDFVCGSLQTGVWCLKSGIQTWVTWFYLIWKKIGVRWFWQTSCRIFVTGETRYMLRFNHKEYYYLTSSPVVLNNSPFFCWQEREWEMGANTGLLLQALHSISCSFASANVDSSNHNPPNPISFLLLSSLHAGWFSSQSSSSAHPNLAAVDS